MEKAIDRLVGKLDDVLTRERQDNPNEEALHGVFMFGHYIVRYTFRARGFEVEVYNPKTECYLDNVAGHCERCAVRWDGIETEESDVWDSHGFAGHSDYLRYKYG